jgi:hypothetical protein
MWWVGGWGGRRWFATRSMVMGVWHVTGGKLERRVKME